MILKIRRRAGAVVLTPPEVAERRSLSWLLDGLTASPTLLDDTISSLGSPLLAYPCASRCHNGHLAQGYALPYTSRLMPNQLSLQPALP